MCSYLSWRKSTRRQDRLANVQRKVILDVKTQAVELQSRQCLVVVGNATLPINKKIIFFFCPSILPGETVKRNEEH